jgi:hypothetical protein
MTLNQVDISKRKAPVWAWIVLGFAGLVLGVGSALSLSNGALGGSKMAVGQWSSDPLVGAKAANPWLRARIARVGLLALSKEETLYFDRTVDEAGNPLREECRYQLSGQPIATR